MNFDLTSEHGRAQAYADSAAGAALVDLIESCESDIRDLNSGCLQERINDLENEVRDLKQDADTSTEEYVIEWIGNALSSSRNKPDLVRQLDALVASLRERMTA